MDEMAEHRGWLIRRGDYQASPRVSYVKRYSALAARSLISSHPSSHPSLALEADGAETVTPSSSRVLLPSH